MRGRRRQLHDANAPGWGDKSAPPAFLARHEDGRPPGWWRGLTGEGKVILVLSILIVAALGAILGLSLSGKMSDGTATKKAVKKPVTAIRKPKPEPRPEPRPEPPVRAAAMIADLELTFFTGSLDNTVNSILKTSDTLVAALTNVFGLGDTTVWKAQGELLADGSTSSVPVPKAESKEPGAKAALAYLRVYERYLANVEATRDAIDTLNVAGGDKLRKTRLLSLCDSLSRDVTVVIESIEMLQAPGDEEAHVIVDGIQSAVERIREVSSQLDDMLGRAAGR